MRNQFREWDLRCQNKDCKEHGVPKKHWKWTDDEKQEHCECCDSELRLHIPVVNEGPMIMTRNFVNKGRPNAEARARSLADFKKNVYDTLPNWERKHFAKKHGWSLNR